MELLRKLFGPHRDPKPLRENDRDRNPPEIYRIHEPSSTKVAGIVRETVASIKKMPPNIISDETILGDETKEVVVSLIFTLNVRLQATSHKTTVGDLIRQCESQLRQV